MTHDYNETQTIMCLNLLANISSLYNGEARMIEEKTYKMLGLIFNDPEVKKLIGEWELVWGPGVFQHTTFRTNRQAVADNTLYVVESKSDQSYVAAVAGTVDASTYDWLVEDLDFKLVYWYLREDVEHKKNWPRFANGIKTGLKNLYELRPGVGPNKDKTLSQFFTQKLKETGGNDLKLNITTTGHSLGGSLSPALALWLKDTQKDYSDFEQNKQKGWNPYHVKYDVPISTISSAGVTFGDEFMQKYISNRLQPNNITRIWNNLDLVPNLWCDFRSYIKNFKNYKDIYGTLEWIAVVYKMLQEINIPPLDDIKHYRHIEDKQEAHKLKGTLQDKPMKDFEELMLEITYQHVDEYVRLLKLEEIMRIVEKILKKDDPRYTDFRFSDLWQFLPRISDARRASLRSATS